METVDHVTKKVEDSIRLVGEIEHLRHHALRSASVSLLDARNAANKEDADTYREAALVYAVWAEQAKETRRKVMSSYFGNLDPKMWCLCKSAAAVKQVAYEISTGDNELLRMIDSLVDDIWSNAVGVDLTGCSACAEDMENGEGS